MLSARDNRRGAKYVPEISLFRCVHHQVFIDPEQVAAPDPLSLVRLLTLIRHLRADDLPDVLDDHLPTRDALHRVQAPVVNRRARKTEVLLARLQLVELDR